MKKVVFNTLGVFIFGLFTLSCTSTNTARFNIDVNSIGSDEGIEKTYFLYPSRNVSNEQLMFNEVSSYINKILHSKGYILVDDYEQANFVLLVDFGY